MTRRTPLDPDLYATVVEEAKTRFAVWPSAYASGWVVKTYKERGGRYAGGDRKNPEADAVFDNLVAAGLPDVAAEKVVETIKKIATCDDAQKMSGQCMNISQELAHTLNGITYVDTYGDAQQIRAFATQLWDVPAHLRDDPMAPGHYVVKVESDGQVVWLDLTAAQFGTRGPMFAAGHRVPRIVDHFDDLRANPPTLEVVDTEEWDDGTVVEFIAMPFPYERKPLAYRDDPTAQGSVRLDELIATQRRVTKAGVESAGDAPIRVYQTTDGRRYIADGHHRAVAAWAAGVEVLPAVIQLVRE